MHRAVPFRASSLLVVLILSVGTATAQPGDIPGSPETDPHHGALRALGDVLFDVAIQAGGVPIGLEADSTGNLLLTDIVSGAISVIDTMGADVAPCGTTTGTLQSVTTDGAGRIWITKTDTLEVETLDAACQPMATFSVAGQTQFPDSLTYNPLNDHLYVVDADLIGADAVLEYTTAGTLVGTFPLATTSTDGIAFDPATNGFWTYDSGGDRLTLYDDAFAIVTSVPGVAAAGFVQGEGVAVIDGVCYVVATGSLRLVAFDCDTSPPPIFIDGFESGDTSAWSVSLP